MKSSLTTCLVGVVSLLLGPASAAEPQLTIYNQNFAVVRTLIPLDLGPGENHVQVMVRNTTPENLHS